MDVITIGSNFEDIVMNSSGRIEAWKKLFIRASPIKSYFTIFFVLKLFKVFSHVFEALGKSFFAR